MAAPIRVTFIGDDANLQATTARSEAALARFAGSAQEAAAKAGKAAADQAAAAGKSAEAQQAAAAKAAAAVVEGADRMTAAQLAAGRAAISAARSQGEAADKQVAAAQKAIAAQGEVEASAKKQADAVEAANTRIKGSMAGLAAFGKNSLMAFGAGAAASVYGAAKLQTAMERIHTQAGVAQSQIKGLTNTVLGSAGSLATGPDQLAVSLQHVYSGGVNGASAMKAMSFAAKEAKISGADLTDTTRSLTSVVYSQIKGSKDLAATMGMLNSIVGHGDMTFQELNDALGGPMISTVKGYGLSMKDVGAALATFGDLNIHGADAATQLRMAVQYMAKPAATAGPLLAKMGLNVHSFADAMANGGLLPALQLLSDRMTKLGVQGPQMAQVIGAIFTKKGASGIDILENSLAKLEQKYQQLPSAAAGASQFQKDWIAWTGTAAGQADKLRAEVQSLADKFGAYLIPKLESVVNSVESVVNWFEKNKGAAQALAAIIEGVLAAAVTAFAVDKAAKFISGVQGMWGAMSKLSGMLMDMPARFSAMGAASTAAEGEVAAAGTGIVGAADTTATGVDAALGSTGVGLVLVGLGVAVTELATHWQQAMSAIQSATQQIIGPVENLLNSLEGKVVNIEQMLPGSHGLSGNRNPNSKANWIYTGGNPATHTSNISGSSPPWVQLGISKQHWNSLSASQKSSLTGGVGAMNPGGTIPGASTPAQIANYLHSQGLSNVAIAGILGNWAQETGGGTISGINTRDSGTGASGMGGMGLAQWTQDRRLQEMAFAKKQGLSPTSLNAQLEYFVSTLKGGYSSTATALQGATSPTQAAELFNSKYEGGTDPGGIRERAAQAAYVWLQKGMKGYTHVSNPGALSSSGLDNLLNLTSPSSTSAASKAAAKRLAIANRRSTSSGSISTTISDDVTRYQDLASSATLKSVRDLYEAVAKQIQDLGPKFEAEAKSASTSAEESKIRDSLKVALTNITDGVAAHVKRIAEAAAAAKKDAAADKLLRTHAGTLESKFQNATQNGTSRTLENALGISTSGRFLPNGGLGMTGGERQSEPAVSSMLHSIIESLGNRASSSSIQRALGSTLSGAAGGQANSHYEQTVEGLIRDGQKKQADALVAAHKAAMQALAVTMYAEQKTKDGAEATERTRQLSNQTQDFQAWAQDSLNVQKAAEQQLNDIASAKLQAMVDAQKTYDDQQAGIAQQTKDTSAISADVGQGIIDAINDASQVQVDTIGERGLYGLALIAQQDKVAQDQVKQYWDQQIDLMQKQYDTDQRSADLAENGAQVALDTKTAVENQLVAQAQARLDQTTLVQQARIANAQAAYNAAVAHADQTLIGPAQIAVDMNANASKADQAKFAAQLANATGVGGYQEAVAYQQLGRITADANSKIQDAQNAFDQTSSSANQLIQDAANSLSTTTDYWNNLLATDASNLSGTQSSAGVAEAGAAATTNVAGANASTQFAGSGLQVNIYGADLNNAGMITDAASWAIRSSGLATV